MDASVQQSGLGARLAYWLPRGDGLDASAFRERHRTLSILLAVHLPVLIVFGIVRGQGVLHSISEMALAGAFLGLAQLPAVHRRLKGILVSAGLVWCSAVIVHFSGGMIEAHFHFFVILGFIALYQDWAAFGWAIVFTALSHGIGSAIAPEMMFNHDSAIRRPWLWAGIHAGMVLFAAVGQMLHWRHSEVNQRRVMELNTALLREQAERQASYSRIYVNLARRNQSLLHRQLAVIDELEQHEEDPDTLRRLFALDHLTTRVRRNAESLLVVAGEESPRRWSTAVTMADIARAAASEIEQYERTDVRVADDVAITGSAVVDITHLLAELIENAAEYSPPETSVVVTGGYEGDGALLTIEDLGIGMSEKDLLAANAVLEEPPELDEQQVRQLGFQVVGRLAQKLGLKVRLRPTVGGSGPRAGAGRKGITAIVEIPAAVLAGEARPASTPAQDQTTDDKDQTTDEDALAEVTPLEGHKRPEEPAPSPVAEAAAPEPAEEPPIAPSTGGPPPPPVVDPTPAPAPAPAPEEPAESPAQPAPTAREDDFTPPPAVTIPPRPSAPSAPAASDDQRAAGEQPEAPAVPPAPPAGEAGSSMLFLAKQPPSTGSPFSRKGRRSRREQPEQQAPAPAPQADPTPPPPAPTPPTPAVTTTATTNGNPATKGGSTIDDIDQLAQYASRLPRRTPGGNLAPGLRDPEPEAEPAPSPGTSPEARQALSAFQSAARSARRSTEETMEHPS